MGASYSPQTACACVCMHVHLYYVCMCMCALYARVHMCSYVHVCMCGYVWIPAYLCVEQHTELFLFQCAGALEEVGWNGVYRKEESVPVLKPEI